MVIIIINAFIIENIACIDHSVRRFHFWLARQPVRCLGSAFDGQTDCVKTN